MASNPYLIKRRIMDKNKLWGVKLLWNGKDYKMPAARLKEVIEHKIRSVLVDMKGQDQPVELVLYNENNFRTIKDGHLCNNFNKLKSIKLISANRFKILR